MELARLVYKDAGLPTTCYHSLSLSQQDEHVSPSLSKPEPLPLSHPISVRLSLSLRHSEVRITCSSPSLCASHMFSSSSFRYFFAILWFANCLSLSLNPSSVHSLPLFAPRRGTNNLCLSLSLRFSHVFFFIF
ncbi:hypothetical protein AMTRI_Chr09g20420 [Amborella trichopoda]